MGKHVLDFSAALLLCGVILVAGVAPVQSWSAEASTPDTLVNGTASGGRYRLAGGAAVLNGPVVLGGPVVPGDDAEECGVALETDPEVPDPPADAGGVPAWAMVQGEAWQTSGAASGGGYRLTGLTGDPSQGGTWQVRGGASGGSYRLDAPAATSSYVGSGCCCTYLPSLMRP